MGAKFTAAQAAAQKEYRRKTQCIQLTLKPSEKKLITSHALNAGMSVNSYIKQAVNEKIEKEDLQ